MCVSFLLTASTPTYAVIMNRVGSVNLTGRVTGVENAANVTNGDICNPEVGSVRKCSLFVVILLCVDVQ